MDKIDYLKKIKEHHPEKFDNYDFSLIPEKIDNSQPLSFKCDKHGVYKKWMYIFINKPGCTKCNREESAKNRTLTTQEFIRRSEEKYSDRYFYDKTTYLDYDTPVIITCVEHGDFEVTPRYHLAIRENYYGKCPECLVKYRRENKFNELILKANKVHNNFYCYDKANVKDLYNKNSIVICPKHGEFQTNLFAHVFTGIGCYTCAKENSRLTQKEFVSKAQKVHNSFYTYEKTIYKLSSDKVIITCPIHGDFEQRAASHLAGTCCKLCFLANVKRPVEEFIKEAKEIHGKKYDYSRVNYQGNKIPVEIICPKHGSIWIKPNTHLSAKAGCSKCTQSKGENAIMVLLEKYGIQYKRQAQIKPYRYRYDFFLPEFNLYIEFNGIQHYKPVETFGGITAFRELVKRDKDKKSIVKEINSKLLILTCFQFQTNSFEQFFIRDFKRLYAGIYVVNGEIKIFHKHIDICTFFKIPESIEIKHLDRAVLEKHKNVKLLFK